MSFFQLFKSRGVRALLAALFLILTPVPVRPEEIEEQMRIMSKAQMVQVQEEDGRDGQSSSP